MLLTSPQHTGNINTGISSLFIQPFKHNIDKNYIVKSQKLHFINDHINLLTEQF